MAEVKKELSENYTFQRLCKKVEKIQGINQPKEEAKVVNVAAVTPRFKTLIESEKADSTPRFKKKESEKAKEY